MKIAFICGSQEPGKDGVGDYTRGLAEECSRQGCETAIVAINDRHVSAVKESPTALRLPAAMSWPERSEQCVRYLTALSPEWVSIQFVTYTFHPKGLPLHLARTFEPILRGRRLHLMFHETWLCPELGWTGRHRVIGTLQRLLIERFVRQTQPRAVHTSNQTYRRLLARRGISADELPLFGAIPVLPEDQPVWLMQTLREHLGESVDRAGLLLAGLFGALHPQWPPEPLLSRLENAARRSRRRLVMLSIGRKGDLGDQLWTRTATENAGRIPFIDLGPQAPAEISQYLTHLDLGIATTPLSIIGKSSGVASMWEHGLPVIVNRDDEPGDSSAEEPLLIRCDSHLEDRVAAGLPKGPRGSRRPAMAARFLRALSDSGGCAETQHP